MAVAWRPATRRSVDRRARQGPQEQSRVDALGHHEVDLDAVSATGRIRGSLGASITSRATLGPCRGRRRADRGRPRDHNRSYRGRWARDRRTFAVTRPVRRQGSVPCVAAPAVRARPAAHDAPPRTPERTRSRSRLTHLDELGGDLLADPCQSASGRQEVSRDSPGCHIGNPIDGAGAFAFEEVALRDDDLAAP